MGKGDKFNAFNIYFTRQFSEEEAALVAGVTGYQVEEQRALDPVTNTSFPVVQSVQGWGMLMSTDSIFRN